MARSNLNVDFEQLWNKKDSVRKYSRRVFNRICQSDNEQLRIYLNELEQLMDLFLTKELNEYNDMNPYTKLSETADFFINTRLDSLVQILMYHKRNLSLSNIFAVNHLLRVLLRFYIRCLQLDIELFSTIEILFGSHSDPKKTIFYERYQPFDDKLKSYYISNRNDFTDKYYIHDDDTSYCWDRYRHIAKKRNIPWLMLQNIEFFIESGGVQIIWDRISYIEHCLHPSDLVNILRPFAQIRDILKPVYFKEIYVPIFISSLSIFMRHSDELSAELNMKIMKNMHFMMNHEYELSQIITMKSILTQNVCEQRLNYYDSQSIKLSATKFNNASTLLVHGFCEDAPLSIVQLCFVFYYDFSSSIWDISETDDSIYIHHDTISRQLPINNTYCNAFGRNVVSFGMHKRWKLKILRKDPNYWYLCSKIGITNITHNGYRSNKAFCDIKNDGFGYKLKDGNIYCSDSMKAINIDGKTYGVPVNVGDIIVVELDLRQKESDKYIGGNAIGRLSFTIIQRSITSKKYRKKKKETSIDLGNAFTNIDAYKQYRLAVALDRREALQVIGT